MNRKGHDETFKRSNKLKNQSQSEGKVKENGITKSSDRKREEEEGKVARSENLSRSSLSAHFFFLSFLFSYLALLDDVLILHPQ